MWLYSHHEIVKKEVKKNILMTFFKIKACFVHLDPDP